MRNKFDMQLELLSEQLIHMGELCEVAIDKATTALQQGSIEQAKEVIAADEEIDQMEKDIERLCLKLLLQQQPVARDLRQISAALKMITDMERIGDQTSDIAEIIISEKKSEASDILKIGKMSEAAARMVRDSVRAYVNKDLELARQVMEADNEVDLLLKEEGEIKAFEIKSSMTYVPEFGTALKKLSGWLASPVVKKCIVYNGDFENSAGEIEIINYRHLRFM